MPRAAGAIGRAESLRHDPLEVELAGMAKHDVAQGSSMCSFKRRPGRLRQHGKRAGLELKPVHPSSQQVEDVVYDMGRDYDVMNRQREGVVGAGIIKR